MNVVFGEDAFVDYPVKVKFAEWAASELANLDTDAALGVFDLRDRLRELVAFVRTASGKAQALDTISNVLSS